jgi:hypothetical protein
MISIKEKNLLRRSNQLNERHRLMSTQHWRQINPIIIPIYIREMDHPVAF